MPLLLSLLINAAIAAALTSQGLYEGFRTEEDAHIMAGMQAVVKAGSS